EFGGLDHHAVLAETAEGRLLFDPCLLNRVQCLRRNGYASLLCPSRRKPFERRDLFTGGGRKRSGAGTDFLTVHQYRTCPALGQAAAELRSRQFEIVSQDIKQRGVHGCLNLAPDSVDDDGGHAMLLPETAKFGFSLPERLTRFFLTTYFSYN